MICDLATYRRLSHDTTSSDDDATAALNDAQQDAEEFCRRQFEQAERTEIMMVYRDGRVYPKSYPITVVDSGTIDGAAIIVGNDYPFGGVIQPFLWSDAEFQPQVTKTYTGGYTADQMPMTLKRAVAKIANAALNAQPLVGVPAGLTSISMGDLSLSSKDGISGMTVMDAQTKKDLSRYKRRTAVAF